MLNKAILRGLDFLVDNISPNGLWSEFSELRHGETSAYPSSIIGAMVWPIAIATNHSMAKTLNETAEALSRLQKPDGSFGYNERCAGDADTTAWVVQLLKIACHDTAKAQAALLTFQQHDGGFATYKAEDFQSLYADRPEVLEKGGDGWTRSHVDVTASAILALDNCPEKDQARKYLLSKRLPSGLWKGYWYGQSYTTTLALEAMGGEGVLPVTAKSLCDLYETDCFAKDMTAIALINLGEPVDQIVDELISSQREDGSWSESCVFGIPRPNQLLPTKDDEKLYDYNRYITTAAAICAISKEIRIEEL